MRACTGGFFGVLGPRLRVHAVQSEALSCAHTMADVPALAPDRITYLQRLVDALQAPEPFTGTCEGSERG